MPIVGTICCRDGSKQLFGHCLDQCGEGACKHPLPMLVNMAQNASKRRGIGVSTSSLGGCPRAFILGRDTHYYEDPEDYYARWFGSFGHYAIEMDGPYEGIIQEVRFFRTFPFANGGSVEISGQPDWIDTKRGIIADHKMVSRKPVRPRQEHIAQLNVYKWLVDGVRMGRGYAIGEMFDIPEITSLQLQYYHHTTSGKHTEFEVPIWDEADVEAYISARLLPIMRYEATQSLVGIGCFGEGKEWLADYCPFRHDLNGGNCCMVRDERIDEE